jgi:hypothetical protein
MNELDVPERLERVSIFVSAGKTRKAALLCESVLGHAPSEPWAMALMARIEAEQEKITFEEALARIEDLAASHPENDRIPTLLISTLYKLGRTTEVFNQGQVFFERRPDSPVAQQTWANILQVDPTTKSDPFTPTRAWELYKQALEKGPLRTLCYKSEAFRVAKKVEPEKAYLALRGTNLIERAGVRTRLLGAQVLASVWLMGLILSVATQAEGSFTLSDTLQIVTITWGIWCVSVNNQLCCKKCRNVWILMTTLSVMYLIVRDIPDSALYVLGAVVVAIVVSALTGVLTLDGPLKRGPQSQSSD